MSTFTRRAGAALALAGLAAAVVPASPAGAAPARRSVVGTRDLLQVTTRIQVALPEAPPADVLAELKALGPEVTVTVKRVRTPRISADLLVGDEGKGTVAYERLDCDLVPVRTPCKGFATFNGRGGYARGTVRFAGDLVGSNGFLAYGVTSGTGAYRGVKGRVVMQPAVPQADEGESAVARAAGVVIAIRGASEPEKVSFVLGR